MSLLLISFACVFLIFLDYHRQRDIYKSVIFVAALFGAMFLLGLAIDTFKFNVLYGLIMVPFALFGLLFWKNKDVANDDQLDEFD